MKIILPVSIMIVIVAAVVVWNHYGAGGATHEPVTLEEKLDVLAGCGLSLAAPFEANDLLLSRKREDFEKPGFDLVLISLGMTEEKEPWRNHCANLWYFDTECIEDHGDYQRIVERLVDMAGGSLPLENINDQVDLETGMAWFSFTFRGKAIKVKCQVDDDWVDPAIFSTFVDLLEKAAPDKIFIYYDLGGQDCILGCVTREELKRLNHEGIQFLPL